MGKTDRSPLTGSKVERDPGVRRTLLTEFFSRFRMPKKLSAKGAAVAISGFLACTAIIVVSAAGDNSATATEADIYIGTETESISSLSAGAGRYSDETQNLSTSDSEVSEEVSTNTVVSSSSETSEADASALDDVRYNVTFEFYGRDSVSCSAEKSATVSELADKLGITFSESDVLNVDAASVISEDTVITTDTVTYGTVSVSTAIEYETSYVDVSSLRSGTTKVVQSGKNGEMITEYECKYVNGIEVSRTETRSYVSIEPVDKIIQRGTAVYTPPTSTVTDSGSSTGGTFVGEDGKTYSYSRYIDVQATVYYTGGTCATGVPADETVIAVDPSVIPLGSKVYITGSYADIGVRTAADTGGSIKGNVIDICVDPSSPLAGNFGFRSMRVYILN